MCDWSSAFFFLREVVTSSMTMFAYDVLSSMDDVIFTQNKKILILSYHIFIMKDTHLVLLKDRWLFRWALTFLEDCFAVAIGFLKTFSLQKEWPAGKLDVNFKVLKLWNRALARNKALNVSLQIKNWENKYYFIRNEKDRVRYLDAKP